MSQMRMRVFAGPNGSGKTTTIKSLENKIPLGVYVNADDIEKILLETNKMLFSTFQLEIANDLVIDFFKKSTFAPLKRNEPNLWEKLLVEDNVLTVSCEIDSYLAADLAEFVRQQLVVNKISFSYETVLSHESKIEFFKKAKRLGYKIYLYFIATEDPEINISRVNVRVAQKGHNVPPETITKRYYKSLSQLVEATKNSDVAYYWDNSGTVGLFFAKISKGIDVEIIDPSKVPNWFIEYLVDPK